jgi:hypothetical protein
MDPVRRGDRIEVMGGRFHGESGYIADANVDRLRRGRSSGGPSIAHTPQPRGGGLHRVKLDNGLVVFIHDWYCFFLPAPIVLSPDGLVLEERHRSQLTSSSEEATTSTVSTDTISSNDRPPESVPSESTISVPSTRTVRAARRAAIHLPPRGPYLPSTRIGAVPQPSVTEPSERAIRAARRAQNGTPASTFGASPQPSIHPLSTTPEWVYMTY